MKTRKLIIIALFFLVLSCKKEGDKNESCKLISIVQTNTTGNQVFAITYNDEGKVATIDQTLGTTSHKDFSYLGNTMYIVTLNSAGNFSQKDSIVLDANGRPLNIRSFSTQDGAYWSNITFEYNGDELKKTVRTDQSNTSATTTTYTYSNGNPVILTYETSSSIVEYYTDKKVQQGDYLQVASLVQYGIDIYPHKNLVKMIASGGSVSNFTYEFNSDGLISKVTGTTGMEVAVLTYGYECK